MKNTAILLAFAAICCFGTLHAQSDANAIDKYFKQYIDNEDFSVVYISPKLFQMLGRLDVDVFEGDEEAEAVLDMAKDIQGLRILITEVNPGKYYEEAKTKINTKEYEVLMTVRSADGDDVDFYGIESDGVIKELLLLVGGDEFVLLSFVGNLDLNKISRLAKEIEDH